MAPAIHLSLDISFPVWTLRRQWSHTFLLSVSLPPCNMGQHGTGESVLTQPGVPLAQNHLDMQQPLVTESVKRAVVNTARDNWEVYFSRFFPATVGASATPPPPRGFRCPYPLISSRVLILSAGQCGHWCSDPSCVPYRHQTPTDDQEQSGG